MFTLIKCVQSIGCSGIVNSYMARGQRSFVCGDECIESQPSGVNFGTYLKSQSQCETVKNLELKIPYFTVRAGMMCRQWSCSRQHLSALSNIPAQENKV